MSIALSALTCAGPATLQRAGRGDPFAWLPSGRTFMLSGDAFTIREWRASRHGDRFWQGMRSLPFVELGASHRRTPRPWEAMIAPRLHARALCLDPLDRYRVHGVPSVLGARAQPSGARTLVWSERAAMPRRRRERPVEERCGDIDQTLDMVRDSVATGRDAVAHVRWIDAGARGRLADALDRIVADHVKHQPAAVRAALSRVMADLGCSPRARAAVQASGLSAPELVTSRWQAAAAFAQRLAPFVDTGSGSAAGDRHDFVQALVPAAVSAFGLAQSALPSISIGSRDLPHALSYDRRRHAWTLRAATELDLACTLFRELVYFSQQQWLSQARTSPALMPDHQCDFVELATLSMQVRHLPTPYDRRWSLETERDAWAGEQSLMFCLAGHQRLASQFGPLMKDTSAPPRSIAELHELVATRLSLWFGMPDRQPVGPQAWSPVFAAARRAGRELNDVEARLCFDVIAARLGLLHRPDRAAINRLYAALTDSAA
jgi:hypothetical protein